MTDGVLVNDHALLALFRVFQPSAEYEDAVQALLFALLLGHAEVDLRDVGAAQLLVLLHHEGQLVLGAAAVSWKERVGAEDGWFKGRQLMTVFAWHGRRKKRRRKFERSWWMNICSEKEGKPR